MKINLLKAVQLTLSALDSNNIDTLDDGNVEAEQIVFIANRVYNEIVSMREWPFLKREGSLLPIGNSWEMKIPDNYTTIHEVRYKNKKIKYLKPSDFNNLIYSRNVDSDVINNNYIAVNKDPDYYTTFDDKTLVFDAYNSETESNLLESNSYIIYNKLPSSDLNYDTDTPELPERFFSVWLDGILAIAFLELKQDTANYQVNMAKYQKGIVHMLRWARNIEDSKPNIYPKYLTGIRSI